MQDPILDYQTPIPAASRRTLTWLEALVIVGVLLIFLAIALRTVPIHPSQSPYHGNRGKCLSNLRMLGTAIALYANENQGMMPPAWGMLLTAEDRPTEYLVCPSSSDNRASSTQPTELRAELATSGHCSYAYLGSGRVNQWTKDDVIAFDTVANHGTSINALFGDGHVESVDGPLARQLVAQKAATQPIRLPANRPTPELHSPR